MTRDPTDRPVRLLAVAAGAVALLSAGVAWLALRHGATAAGGRARSLREVTDMAGERIRIPETPRRVLSLCTSATDAVVSLGAADRLTALDEFGLVVPGSERAVVVGRGGAIARERVAALRIDLAFVWWYQDDAAAVLKDLSVPVVRIRSGRAAELPPMVRLIGDCLNRREAAERMARDLEAFLSRPAPQPVGGTQRVYLELYGPFKTAGGGTYTNDLLELAGCANVAAELRGYAVLSAEKLVRADPDVVLCVGDGADAESLARRPGVSDLRAVREGRVIALDRYWLVAGPNLPHSVERIRAAIARHAAKP